MIADRLALSMADIKFNIKIESIVKYGNMWIASLLSFVKGNEVSNLLTIIIIYSIIDKNRTLFSTFTFGARNEKSLDH